MDPLLARLQNPNNAPMEEREMRAGFLLILAALTSNVAAQTAYKCVDAKGRTTLQQAPCANGQRINVTTSSFGDPPPPPSKAEVAAFAAGEERRDAIAAGLRQGYPVVGMNVSQLAQVLGQPDRVNTSDYGPGLEEQRIYDRGDRTIYVYTAGGLVRSIQNNARIGAQARSGPCPTSTEIRNLESSASSITIGESQRKEMMKAVKEMKACVWGRSIDGGATA
jgi:hypothetical protein